MQKTRHSINNTVTDEDDQSTIYIGRQPIFDRKMNIFAYELLYRDSNENRAKFACHNAATTTVILNLIIEFGFSAATANKTAFINLSDEFLTGESPVQIPAEKAVLEVLEDTVVNEALISNLQKLVDQGFSLALDDFIYSSKWDPVLALVDYIKVEIPQLNREEIKQHVTLLKKYNVKLIAEKIESEEEYNFLYECGFDLFQGYFLAKPKIIKGKTIPANKLAIISLLAELNNDKVKISDLVTDISKDISLCYKILRYINSAHYALVRKVESISEAITYVGTNKLKHWASLIAMSNISNKPDDLMQLTMTRAYMCEQIAEQLGENDPQNFFYIGLLSTLDMLLGLPMNKILETLPLSNSIQNAIMYFDGKEGKVLECVIAYEQADWNKINGLELDIKPEQLCHSFFNAIHQTNNSILRNIS